MILLVEAGNSAFKWVNREAADPGDLSRAFYSDHANYDDLFTSAWSELTRPERVIVSNVAGDALLSTLADWVLRHWDIDVETIIAQANACGVINAYAEPGRLGADRWSALVAARHSYPGNVCIVDAGTAITIDALSQDGTHLGGLIIPGISMMRQALADHTHIDMVDAGDRPESESLLGNDTETAIVKGTINSAIAVIDETVKAVSAKFDGSMRCLLTGGDAHRIAEYIKSQYEYVPMLVFMGMDVIACQSQAGKDTGAVDT